MRVEQILRIALALGMGLVPLSLLARSQQASHSQAASASPASDSTSKVPAVSTTSATSNSSMAQLSEFSWLEGRWRGEWGPRVAEQVWLSPKAGAMEGVFRLLEVDKTLVIEFFTLVQKPQGIAFYFRHFTPMLVPWEKSDATVLNLVSFENNKFVFENAVNGMPKSATLIRTGPDEYVSRSELVPETGEPQIIEITYKRQTVSALPTNAGSAAHRKTP